jgi:hypothetical protein
MEARDAKVVRRHLVSTLADGLAARLKYGTIVRILEDESSTYCNPSFHQEFFTWTLPIQFQKFLEVALCTWEPAEKEPLLIILDDIHKCNALALNELFEMMALSLRLNLPIHYLVSGSATPGVKAGLAEDNGLLKEYVVVEEVHPFVEPDIVASGVQATSIEEQDQQSLTQEGEGSAGSPQGETRPTQNREAKEEEKEGAGEDDEEEEDFDPTATFFSAKTSLGSTEELLSAPAPETMTTKERSTAFFYVKDIQHITSSISRLLRGGKE